MIAVAVVFAGGDILLVVIFVFVVVVVGSIATVMVRVVRVVVVVVVGSTVCGGVALFVQFLLGNGLAPFHLGRVSSCSPILANDTGEFTTARFAKELGSSKRATLAGRKRRQVLDQIATVATCSNGISVVVDCTSCTSDDFVIILVIGCRGTGSAVAGSKVGGGVAAMGEHVVARGTLTL